MWSLATISMSIEFSMSDSLFAILEIDDQGMVNILEEYDASDGESEIENVSSGDEKWFVNESGNLVSEELYPNGFLERKTHLPTGDGFFYESSEEYIDPDGNVVIREEEMSDNIIFGGSGKKARGTAGDDYFFGQGKFKKILGFGGDDIIDPGEVKNGSKYVKCKGGSGADTFVIEDQYKFFIKDFDVIEDKLEISGLSGGFDYEIKGKSTFIFGEDGDVVVKIKGVFDLSEANIV